MRDFAWSNLKGTTDIQVIPSGPGETGDGLLQMLLALINAAQEELVLTTPYLVPDDAMILALRGAAGRGVKVTVIVPEKVDSLLTRYASRSYYEELLDLGVEIQLYRGGLLHTKSISVDGAMAMFGTVNFECAVCGSTMKLRSSSTGPSLPKRCAHCSKPTLITPSGSTRPTGTSGLSRNACSRMRFASSALCSSRDWWRCDRNDG